MTSSDTPTSRLTDEPIDVAAVSAAVRRPDYGAVLLFLGTVRNYHQGKAVTHLTYSAYRAMAETRLAAIVNEMSRDGTVAVEIVHSLGGVSAGEPSVVIAVASPHRDAAYQASRTALERLKAEVPIWKKEHFADGAAAWREVEPLAAPGVAASR